MENETRVNIKKGELNRSKNLTKNCMLYIYWASHACECVSVLLNEKALNYLKKGNSF